MVIMCATSPNMHQHPSLCTGLRAMSKVCQGKLRIQIIIVISGSSGATTTDNRVIWPIDCSTAATLLILRLHLLAELIVLGKVCNGHRAPCASHCLLEVLPANLVAFIHIHVVSL